VSKSLNLSSSEASTPQRNNSAQVGPKFSDFEHAKFEYGTPIVKKMTIITTGSTAPTDLLHFGPHLHKEMEAPFDDSKFERINEKPSLVKQPILKGKEELEEVDEFPEVQKVARIFKEANKRYLCEEKYRIEEYDKEYAACCELIIFNW
jgi:hypothetical protein